MRRYLDSVEYGPSGHTYTVDAAGCVTVASSAAAETLRCRTKPGIGAGHSFVVGVEGQACPPAPFG